MQVTAKKMKYDQITPNWTKKINIRQIEIQTEQNKTT